KRTDLLVGTSYDASTPVLGAQRVAIRTIWLTPWTRIQPAQSSMAVVTLASNIQIALVTSTKCHNLVSAMC
ncbi:hypothetical protein, partial [Corynebacterium glyciniphilum]|uniref:hypothetical protein n=1 Tax=Corynebacterium glyciniphilum TaxID=1404244 RepID=UPI003DA18012